ncbi:SDR family oxidoreductase [Pikeienuella piscinae]|uniref:SDR family oxidoreductase n=1 Tax=Pikeienuella piscinae TaxID=2748098 RepID=A0A7M3T5I2_9RHOB|nr:SDR family oxidoreductase [Pikeienuella piscinae]QIE57263.1 SDR family oxidoreductase [Pikeienuella piscinae]
MNDASLNGRAVLVTGGTRGLGRVMARALAGAGARVAITGVSDSARLRRAAGELSAAGAGDSLAIAADAADPDQAAMAVERTNAAFGRIDVLVNNAGLGMRLVSERFNLEPAKFWTAPPASWARIVGANVNGPFFTARAAAPLMIAQGFGKIVNISTSAQTMVRTGYSPYGPSKAFLEAASRAWAADLAGAGVDVNVLLPGGATDTDLLPPSPKKRGADGNLLDPRIMRAPILWLASDASNGVTGGRFIARLWPDAPPYPGAARDAAPADEAAPPRIM